MKVIVKGRENRDQLEIFSIEGFVPADHLLRKIDSAVDFNHIYDISQVTNWVRLKFATMNLKKYALHRWKRSHQYSALIRLYTFFAKTKLITLNLAWNLGLFDRLKRRSSCGAFPLPFDSENYFFFRFL